MMSLPIPFLSLPQPGLGVRTWKRADSEGLCQSERGMAFLFYLFLRLAGQLFIILFSYFGEGIDRQMKCWKDDQVNDSKE